MSRLPTTPPPAGVAAVVFDVDGTLYRAAPLKLAMAAELTVAVAWAGPAGARRLLAVIRAYRRAHEDLRREAVVRGDLAAEQVRRAATAAGVGVDEAASFIATWMERRPLRHLRRARRRGLSGVLQELRGRGLALGVVSDYAARAKLEALGVATAFDAVVSAADPEVGALKPDPRGLQLACERLGVDPGRALYVGDRADVDLPAAAAAGMPAVLLGSEADAAGSAPAIRDLRKLAAWLDRGS